MRRDIRGQLARNARLDAIEISRVGAQGDRLGKLVVLGLGKQVHGDPVGIHAAVAHDQDFGRTRHHVDADHAEYTPLRRCHVGVAGSDDLVDLRDRLRAVSKRCHRLSAADGEHTIDPGEGGCRQHELVALAVWCGHRHDDLADAGDARRNHVHQDRRRIRGLPAGYVDADALERRDALPKPGAVRLGIAPRFDALPRVKAADAVRGSFERDALVRGNALEGGAALLPRDLETCKRSGVQPIEPPRVFEHCLVAACAHRGNDLRDHGVDARVLRRLECEQPFETRGEIGIDGGKTRDRAHCLAIFCLRAAPQLARRMRAPSAESFASIA